jgi:hypothetical protein
MPAALPTHGSTRMFVGPISTPGSLCRGRTLQVRRRWLVAGAVLACFMAFFVAPSFASAACGYGNGGSTDSPYASTLCWLDLSGYNDADARDGSGQNMSIPLPGGYTMTFNLSVGGVRNTFSSGVPTNGSFSYIGTYGYTGIPGAPALRTESLGAVGPIAGRRRGSCRASRCVIRPVRS